MTHYRYLTAIQNEYTTAGPHGAEVGQPGHRAAFLDGMAQRYRTAKLQLDAAIEAAKNPAPIGGTVRERSRQFENFGATKAAQQAAVGKARDKLLQQERWLTRMGAKLTDTGHIDWGFSFQTVVYDMQLQEQGLTRLRFQGGRLFTDDAFKQPLDTRSMVTANMGPGFAIYVMSETGNLHVSSHSVGHRHHSSLLAGANVAGAGELQAKDGTLVWISNKSGHYFPAAAHFLQTIHSLSKKGVPLDAVRASFLFVGSPQKGVPYANVAAFLTAMQVGGQNDFELDKLLSYLMTLPFAAFSAMIAGNGWRWVTGAEHNAGLRAVVTTAGVQVPHRDVRRWLKAQGRVATVTVKP